MDRTADSGGSVPIAADAARARARAVVAAVTDPEIPVLTLDDLGVLRLARAWEQLRPAPRPWPAPPGA